MRVKNLNEDKVSEKRVQQKNKWTWLIFLILILLICRMFVFCVTIVSGMSMEPTYYNGNVVGVFKAAYVFSEPQKNDIVIACEPIENTHVIKRITGTPGDLVEYNGNTILLRDKEYFITGDNTENSTDSHIYGPIEIDRIIGKVVFKVI